MVYILYISEINTPSLEEIERIISIHENDQDSVITKYVDKKLDGGFDIAKEDDTLTNLLKRDKEARESLDYRIVKAKAKEAKIIKDGARYSGDTVVTKGEKPYSP